MTNIKTKLTISVLALSLFACTDEPGAVRSLRGAGYTDIELRGYGWFMCDSKSDTFATKFTAKGPTGLPVSGAVCSGWLKGGTIRTN